MASKYDNRKPLFVLLCCVIFSGVTAIEELEIITPPRDAYALKDAPLVLDCATAGQPGIVVIWRRDGQEINLDGQRSVLGNGSLLIDSVLPKKDAGIYQCCATNNYGTICSASVTVTIAILPRFDVHPQPLNISEGGTARLTCHTEAAPPPEISWKHDKRTINPTLDERVTVLPGGILQIIDVSPADVGDYRCIAENIADKRRSQPAALVVQPRVGGGQQNNNDIPQIVAGPTSLQKVNGEGAVFECLVDAREKSTLDVSWTREDGSAIRTQGVYYTGSKNLHFNSVTTSDAGIYICTATNTTTGSHVQASSKLTVYVPPTIRDAPNSAGGVVQRTARFSCVAVGITEPTIQWVHNGVVVVDREGYSLRDNEYIIKGALPHDKGIIQCVATNEAGVATANAELSVDSYKDISPPSNIRGIVLSSTSILVTWNPPLLNAEDVIAYTLHYQPPDDIEIQEAIGKDTFTFAVEELKPYTEYAFYLQTWTKEGPGPASVKGYCTTLEASPVEAPVFTGSSNNPDTITIKWEPLPERERNGVVTKYKIIWKLDGGAPDTENEWEVVGGLEEYTIVDLQADTLYQVCMAAKTTEYGPVSEWVRVRTWIPDGRNVTTPHAPHMELSTPSPTSIQVLLGLPSLGTPIIGYKLFYKHKGAKDDEGKEDLLAMITSHEFKELDEETTYEIRALAYNRHGDGHSVVQAITTPAIPIIHRPPVPGEMPWPDTVNLTAISPRRLRIRWKTPQTNQFITGYTVKYWHKANTSTAQQRFVPSTVNRTVVIIDIGNLLPFSVYKLQIRSHGIKGPGRYSPNPWTAKTLEDRPSTPPSAASAVPVNAHTINVQWQPPNQPNGVLTHFVIMYNMDLNVDDVTWKHEERNGTARNAIVEGLNSATKYYFKVRAGTQAGEGPPTSVIEAQTLDPPIRQNKGQDKTRERGILIGTCLALSCIICCSVFIICKRRVLCSQNYSPHVTSEPVNCRGAPLQYSVNGGMARVYMANTRGEDPDSSFTPMLSHLPEPPHMDTKGGSPLLINGNGPIHGSYHSNGILPQGAGHPPHNHCHGPLQLDLTEDGGSSSLGSTDPDGSGTALLAAEVKHQRSQELHDSGTEIPMSSLDNADTANTQDLSCHGNSCSGNHSPNQELPHHCTDTLLDSSHNTGVNRNNGAPSRDCDRDSPNLPQQNGCPVTASSGVNISDGSGSPTAKTKVSTTTSPHRKEPVRLKQSTGKSLPHWSPSTKNDSLVPQEDIWERRSTPSSSTTQNTPLSESSLSSSSSTPTSATTSTDSTLPQHRWDEVPRYAQHSATTSPASPDYLPKRMASADCYPTTGSSAKTCTV